MFARERIERFDASYGIPRKANEQYLPSYNAFWHWAADVGKGGFYVCLGLIEAGLFLFAGWLFDQPGLINLAFWAMALCGVCAGLSDAYDELSPYRVRRMSTAHGSARWAKVKDLIRCGLMNRVRGIPLPANSLPIAKAFGGRDIFLPPSQWLRHFVMFGPTGSGKSKTFFISMIRAILGRSSCLVYDPKGELFAQTAGSAKRVFRLDLSDPTKSDRWNFIPKCRNDPAFACQVAGMMIGIESRRRTNADPFWGDAEQIALTAILLHIAEVYREKAIPAFAADFLLSLGENEKDAFAEAMKNSPSLYAKQAYLAFRQAPIQTRGSILIGLYNKLRPFTLAPARMVTMPPTPEEIEASCRNIAFAELRKPGTAIYLVVSEGAADIYKEFIATFLGQAVMEMRLDGLNEPEHPCFVLIDEAYQLNVAEVKRISGIGRGRGVGLGLGYQDLPQMYDQYGRERANAILGTVMTKIFLPGLDDVTAEYASKQLGDTTIFSKTFQDYPGKKHDNTRYAEQKRALMLASEIRQIAAHSEVLIISDTAPPIRAAYPPLAVLKNSYTAKRKGTPRETDLGDIDPAFSLQEARNDKAPGPKDVHQATLQELVNNFSNSVDRKFTDERIIGLLSPATANPAPEQTRGDEMDAGSRHSAALDDLTYDLRFHLADQYQQVASPA
ncbi:MAG TPA: type IV secretory system conjugative DNA transfer family protein [Pyrinomonadaceae bacterium]|nr:type IV secretory system conjugative DNA transfer family protein [Pyrinomonadaceae bacterium]